MEHLGLKVADLNTGREQLGGIEQHQIIPRTTDKVEEFDGSSWTEVADLNRAQNKCQLVFKLHHRNKHMVEQGYN